jgi:peroxiredoxin
VAAVAVAIVAMVVVVVSRPSGSQQSVSLLHEGDPSESSAAPETRSLDTQSRDNSPTAEPAGPRTTRDATASSPGASNDAVRAVDTAGVTTSQSDTQEREADASAHRKSSIADPLPDTEQAMDRQGAGDTAPEGKPAGAGQSPADAAQKRSESAASRGPLPHGTAAGRSDALKRLSQEFARRAAARRNRSTVKATPVALPAHEIFPPTVSMTHQHRESCLVYVGDQMPPGTLPDRAGTEQPLQDLLGHSPTVIVFWNAGHPLSRDQFEHIPRELAPFKELGIETIAVHVGPPPDDYAALCGEHGEDVHCLLDGDGSYFAQVAAGSVPRTYLLDAHGQVVWLDIEYSRSTRYDLRNALHYTLRNGKTATD